MVVMTSTLSILSVIVILSLVSGKLHAQAISNTVNEDPGEQPSDSDAVPSTANRQAENPLRSFLSRGGRLPNIASARDAILSGNFDRFTPAPITDPNCHVDVQVVQRVPGRCIRIANGLPACQTEHWLSINTDECS